MGISRTQDRLLPGVALLARAGNRGRWAASKIEYVRLVGFGPYVRGARTLRRLGVPGRGARDAVYARIWSEGAAAAGAEFIDRGRGFYEVRRGDRRIPLFQQVTPIDDAVTLRLALEKPLVHELLADAGVAIPDHVEFSIADAAPALELIERIGRCVVKPASGTGGGEGVDDGCPEPRRSRPGVPARGGLRRAAAGRAPGAGIAAPRPAARRRR